MKDDEIFRNVRMPSPPAPLRESVIAQAERAFGSELSVSRTIQLWESRPVKYAWSIGLAASLLILIFWNPPLPGKTTLSNLQEISSNDRIDRIWLGRQLRSRASTQISSAAALRYLKGANL